MAQIVIVALHFGARVACGNAWLPWNHRAQHSCWEWILAHWSGRELDALVAEQTLFIDEPVFRVPGGNLLQRSTWNCCLPPWPTFYFQAT